MRAANSFVPALIPHVILSCAVILFTSITISACGDGPGEVEAPVGSITVTPATISFSALGDTEQLSATAIDQAGAAMSGIQVTWSSSDAAVATVNSSGQVTAVANGAARITATADGVNGTADVTVAQEVALVAVTPSTASLVALGATVQLGAIALDVNDNEISGTTAAWSSSDESVATVSTAGLVTAVAYGSATITATVPGGAGGSATITVYAVEVQGIVSQDTTWEQANSPIHITGTVQVPNGVTLTIEPGVSLRYRGAYEILIKGALIANGTAQNRITFTSDSAGTSSGATLLKFKGTDLSKSQLSHIDMDLASIAIQIGEETEHNQGDKNTDTLAVSNVDIDGAQIITDGYQTTAALFMSNATIANTTIRGNYPRSEPMVFTNSTITNTTINSDSYNKGITIRNSTVTDCGLTMGCCGANFLIDTTTVTNSTVAEGGGSPVSGLFKVTASDLVNSPITLPAAQVELTSTEVRHSGAPAITMGNGVIDSSSVQGPGFGNGLLITGLAGYNVGGSVSITNSTFVDHAEAIRFTGANTVTIAQSNFDRVNSYYVENHTARDITATSNWWGTTNAATITARIYDYDDDINYGVVTYNPFLTSPSLTAPPLPPPLPGQTPGAPMGLGQLQSDSVTTVAWSSPPTGILQAAPKRRP